MESSRTTESSITFREKFGYGMGHVFNDLCGSMWYTYILLFYSKVLELDSKYAGVVMLMGQLADGIATVLVGFLSDKPATLWLCLMYGRRKTWHLIGTICVFVSFPFLFLPCIFCDNTSDDWIKLIYYCFFAVVWSCGWACVQTSHLALIPAISSSQDERTGLTAIRHAMKVVSYILVYLVAWAIFGMGSIDVSSANINEFRNIMLVVMGIGSITSIVFHITVKEDVSELGAGNDAVTEKDTVVPMTVVDWFGEPQLYQVAGVYMSSRQFMTISQTYIPFYLIESLKLPATYIAVVPLVMFIAGFVMSFFMKPLRRLGGGKVTYLLGSGVGVAACVFVYFGSHSSPIYVNYGIFVAAGMLGMASSIQLITSLSITAEFIAQSTDSSAFIYGAMSFADKMVSGVVVMMIQEYVPSVESGWYFRDILFIVSGSAALLGAFFVASLPSDTLGKRRRDRKE